MLPNLFYIIEVVFFLNNKENINNWCIVLNPISDDISNVHQNDMQSVNQINSLGGARPHYRMICIIQVSIRTLYVHICICPKICMMPFVKVSLCNISKDLERSQNCTVQGG